jgi:hypothetical protein
MGGKQGLSKRVNSIVDLTGDVSRKTDITVSVVSYPLTPPAHIFLSTCIITSQFHLFYWLINK